MSAMMSAWRARAPWRAAVRDCVEGLSYRRRGRKGNRMNRDELKTLLTGRLRAVEDRIAAACGRAGRSRDEITLVAVTKTVSAEVAGLLPELGVLDLGENRPQELWSKAAALPTSVRW